MKVTFSSSGIAGTTEYPTFKKAYQAYRRMITKLRCEGFICNPQHVGGLPSTLVFGAAEDEFAVVSIR